MKNQTQADRTHKLKAGLVIDLPFHEANKWVSATTWHLIEGIREVFDCLPIQSQTDYESVVDQLDCLISMEPGWAAPKLDLADAVAASTAHIRSSSYQSKILLALLPRASTQALVHASGQIGSSGSRSKVLLAIAQKRGLTAAEADTVAHAAPGIRSSSYEAKVLKALVGQASTVSLARAARQISSSRQHYEVLASIARKPSLTAEEADVLAEAASAVPSSSYRAKLILALVPLASIETILTSARSVSGSRDKYEVMKALAEKRGLSQQEADRVVAAVPSSLSSTYKARLLIALIGRASYTALSAAAKKISSRSERLRVLEALSKKGKKRRIL